MSLSKRSHPSPAMVVAVVALSFALAGSAVAGTEALNKAVSKSKVKQIAKRQGKKQANKAIDKRAPGLSVANAVNAENARTAANGATAFGNFTAQGVARDGSFNMNDLTVSTLQPSIYCEDQPFGSVVAGGAVATTGGAANASALDRETLAATAGATPADVGCPANTEWIYATFDSTGGGGTVPAFFQVVAH